MHGHNGGPLNGALRASGGGGSPANSHAPAGSRKIASPRNRGSTATLLDSAVRSRDSGGLPSEELQQLVRYTSHVLHRLPQVFGPRFGFDAVQINAITGGPGIRPFFRNADPAL
jgi:hypothetical protein